MGKQDGLRLISVPTPSPSGGYSGGHSAFRSRIPVSADSPFEIKLVYEGRSVVCHVSEGMQVINLIQEASNIFHLEPSTVLLMLFSMTPLILDRNLTLFGPPRVTPNSTVMVFVVHGQPAIQEPNLRSTSAALLPNVPGSPQIHSKLLGTFKLPKFNGTPKAWKQWDRDFVRFLGLHQLEHVLHADFLFVKILVLYLIRKDL